MQKTYKNFTVKQSKIKEVENCNVLTEILESTRRKLIGKHHTEKINNIHNGLFSITTVPDFNDARDAGYLDTRVSNLTSKASVRQSRKTKKKPSASPDYCYYTFV